MKRLKLKSETILIETIMNNTPSNYKPYHQLIICSNKLVDCNYFIDHNGFYPILIGQELIPLIWINNRIEKNNPIVEQSISKDTRIKIDINVLEKKLTVRLLGYNGVKNDIILNMTYDNNNAIVDILDMRPLGYNIYGDSKGITAGGNTYSQNEFINIKSMFVFEE